MTGLIDTATTTFFVYLIPKIYCEENNGLECISPTTFHAIVLNKEHLMLKNNSYTSFGQTL